MDLRAYLDAAKAAQGIPSNNRLARALDISAAFVSDLYSGKRFPSDAMMLRIAALAGAPADVALIELNTWRTRGPAQAAYAAMLRRIAAAAVVIAGTLALAPAAPRAGLGVSAGERALNITEHRRRRRLRMKAGFSSRSTPTAPALAPHPV